MPTTIVIFRCQRSIWLLLLELGTLLYTIDLILYVPKEWDEIWLTLKVEQSSNTFSEHTNYIDHNLQALDISEFALLDTDVAEWKRNKIKTNFENMAKYSMFNISIQFN